MRAVMKRAAIGVLVCGAVVGGYLMVSSRNAGAPVSPRAVVTAGLADASRTRAEPIRTRATVTTEAGPELETPAAALEAEVDSLRHGDVSAVARRIVLTPDARTVIEAVRTSLPPQLAREYQTPETLVAFMFCGGQRIESFRVESSRVDQADRFIQSVAYKFESEPGWRTESIVLARTDHGWCQVVDVGMARRIASAAGIETAEERSHPGGREPVR